MKRDYQDWLAAFCEYGSYSESPHKFIFWAGVSAIAGALERRVWIDQGRYLLYPNFYIVFVSPAGKTKKSSSVRDALGLLRAVPGIHFGPDAITWEALIERMLKNAAAEGVLTMDSNVTAYSALTADVDELSTFLDVTNQGLVSALIKLWDCPPKFDRETRAHGIEYIENPCLNLIAGTTPAWIRGSFDRWSQEGGFASRTIFVHSETRSRLLAFPKRKMPANRASVKLSLIEDLKLIADLRGEYKVEEEAYDWGEKWYEEFHGRVDQGLSASTGFTSRKLDHALKMAMVLAASRREQRWITLKDMQDAAKIIDDVEPDLEMVFSVVDERAELRPYTDLQTMFRRYKKLTKAKVCGEMGKRYMLHEIERSLSLMREAGELQQVQEDGQLVLVYQEVLNAK